MYFGSVRFFKHLILGLIALLVISSISVTMLLVFKSQKSPHELIAVRVLADKDVEHLPPVKTVNKTENHLDSEKLNKQVVESDIMDYHLKYPDLYATSSIKKLSDKEKITYLTFDDGPSKQTLKVLDILDKYKVKATFFVVYKNDEFSNSVYKEIVKRGHTIGVHTASHDYKKIYSSVDSYLEDFNKMYSHIYKLTGVKANLFRFAGGSINSYNYAIYQPLIAEMLRRGFTFHDWNVEAGDASTKATKKSIYNSVVNNVKKKDKSIVLMHDSLTSNFTVEALPSIIEEIKKAGYAFNKLDANVAPFLFSYKS